MKRILLLSALGMLSCVAEPDFQDDYLKKGTLINGNFDFATIGTVTLNFTFQDAKSKPFAGIKVELLDPKTSKVLYKAFTNSQGVIVGELNLPTDIDQVVLETNYIGLPNRLVLPVRQGSIKLDFLGEVNPDQVIQYEIDPSWIIPSNASSRINTTFSLEYLSTYTGGGKPGNLEPTLDYISARLLEYINASLPEAQPVPSYHPTFLAEGKKTTLDIVETADVWLTFVHEGAGWRNSIGFYTYPTNQPPSSLADIKKVTVLFPNLSASGSGGELKSGNKLKLGRFEPGVTIGIAMLSNGWNGSAVAGWQYPLFADKLSNPEPDKLLKQHNVLLWDEENKLFLLGFEDVRRDNIPFKSDQDFNDAIFFVTSNPFRAISTLGVSPVDKPGTLDSDNDGINNNLDEYPNDPQKAYDSYYPSSTGYGSFAFEDNWPEMGDYDFNDLVVDYQFKNTLNSSNMVTEISPKFKFRAIGAGFRNGFGFSLEITADKVKSVSGNILGPSLIKSNSNGTEAGQKKAVVIVSDNAHLLFGASAFVNTQEGSVAMNPVELQLTIKLSQPVSISALGNAPYNPFLIIAQDRGREVHLPGYSPTDLIDTRLMGTADDNSNTSTGYFKSKTSLPWAIHLPESFAYPKEKSDIRSAHLRFNDWSKSSGYSYMDWYRDYSGYRKKEAIY